MESKYNPFEEILDKLGDISRRLAKIEELSDKSSKGSRSRQGGLDLAQEVTGYTKSYIRKLSSEGLLPVISEPYAPLWFDESQLLDYMKGKARKTKDQIAIELDKKYATLKRVRK